ncbi:MAG: glycine cleavage system aminomethyltransferase GcvT [Erythrobacter sp.]|nr:MAG: glycine cleavage system aminomethyltransferase GcvT [Erythrobacter sp.]
MSEPANDSEAEDLPLEKLPLDAWHRQHGARMVPFAGYEMPIQYAKESGGGIVAEHEWTRSSASLFDVSHMGQLMFTADEPQACAIALEAILPAALSTLRPNHARYSLLLTEDGGILDDLIVTRLPDEQEGGADFYMVVNGAMKWDDIAHLREHLPDEITMTHLDEWALLALQGPEAASALEQLIPGVAELGFMTAGAFDWPQGNTALWISRTGYTGEDGFEISIEAERASAFCDALLADERVKPAGLGARDSLRLEAGLPLYGHDLTTETDPVSADLAFALSKPRREGGGYPGHGRLSKLLTDGAPTRRVGLALEGRQPAREGAEVFAGDQKVGTVTSGGFSPTLGHPIAMAYVDSAVAGDGTALEIEVRGRRLPARVTPLPFVPHCYIRKGA